MEGCRSFQVTLISASNLKNVRRLLEMKVYAKAFISGNPGLEKATPVDMEGKTDAYWNYKLQFTIPEKAVQQEGRENLVVKLYCKRSLKYDKYVGEREIPLKELFDNGLARENVEYDVYRNGDEGKFGTLKLSYSFGPSTKRTNDQGQPSSGTRSGGGWGDSYLTATSALADHIQIGQALYGGVKYAEGLGDGGDEEEDDEADDEEE